MTKKGDLLNQLAIISDLLEKINLETETSGIFSSLTDEKFDEVKNYLVEKTKTPPNLHNNEKTMYVYIGDVQIVFSKEPFINTNNA